MFELFEVLFTHFYLPNLRPAKERITFILSCCVKSYEYILQVKLPEKKVKI